MKRLLTLSLSILLTSILLASNPIIKETYTYASKNGIDLKLDKYDIINNESKDKPCIIFMFGGGFVNGERDSERYLPYFHSLAENGNIVVSIDYRRNLRDLKSSSIARATDEDFIKLFYQTITVATEDLMDATSYILANADNWNVDESKIVISGSSAGAIAILNGEYVLKNEQPVADALPKDFKYAGIISFAGAIFSAEGNLEWKAPPAPMLMFHGNADKNVPYNSIEMGPIGFYGTKHIVAQLEEMNIPYHFYDEEYAAHELADTPMQNNLDIINDFVKREIVKQKGFRIHTQSKVNGREAVNTEFTIKDYIMMNFAPR